uniref:Helicase n=1 Tax=Solanum tuberosum TaxID=4113 RepID=M1BVD6_SOLTU
MQILVPKSRRGYDDEYCSSVTSRKGTGAVNIKLPHLGNAAGMNYEVRGVDNKDFLYICVKKIKIDQVRLLEDVSAGAYSNAIQQLLGLKSEGNKYPPALDPVKGMSALFISLSVPAVYIPPDSWLPILKLYSLYCNQSLYFL